MKRALLGLIALAVGCGSPQPSTLFVYAGDFARPAIYDAEWPRDSGEFVTVNMSLADSAGLAGLVVEAIVPGRPTQVLTADSFHEDPGGGYRVLIDLPDEGRVSAFVKLYQSGELVAEGNISWPLHPHRDRWLLFMHRAPFADGASAGEYDRCIALTCHTVHRFTIREDARNSPDESLWLVLFEDWF